MEKSIDTNVLNEGWNNLGKPPIVHRSSQTSDSIAAHSPMRHVQPDGGPAPLASLLKPENQETPASLSLSPTPDP